MTFEDTSVDQELIGLGGWLAFYVFGRFLSAFSLSIGILLALSHNLINVFPDAPKWSNALVGIVFSMSLIANIYFIDLFFRYKQVAIRYTKMYLVATTVLIVSLDPILTSGFTLTPNGHPYPWLGMISGVAFRVAWYLYFQRSKRVYRTLVL